MPVYLGRGVWIGASCTICPGVSIGEGTVVAVGSIVISDVEPNVLVGGTGKSSSKAIVKEATEREKDERYFPIRCGNLGYGFGEIIIPKWT